MKKTKAHTQTETLHLTFYYPEHAPREHDPHYHLFERARAHLARSGNWKCAVCGATEGIEAHHHLIEFALANGIDIRRFEEVHPEYRALIHDDPEAFAAFVESEHNILPLCVLHHRGAEGIHMLPGPVWEALRYWKKGLPLPGRVSRAA